MTSPFPLRNSIVIVYLSLCLLSVADQILSGSSALGFLLGVVQDVFERVDARSDLGKVST